MSSPSSEIILANLQYLQSKLACQVSAFEHRILVTKNRIILRNRKQILKYYIYNSTNKRCNQEIIFYCSYKRKIRCFYKLELKCSYQDQIAACYTPRNLQFWGICIHQEIYLKTNQFEDIPNCNSVVWYIQI